MDETPIPTPEQADSAAQPGPAGASQAQPGPAAAQDPCARPGQHGPYRQPYQVPYQQPDDPYRQQAGPYPPGGGYQQPGAVPPGAGAVPPRTSPLRSFFASVRRTGLFRSEERWVGGVAGGLARRLDLDPVLVRCVWVVLMIFSGLGLVLYGLAWALLPEERDGRIHVEQAAGGDINAGLAGAVVAFITGCGLGERGLVPAWFVLGWTTSSFGRVLITLFWVGLIMLVLWALTQVHRARRAPQPGAPQPGAPTGFAQPDGPAQPAPATSTMTTDSTTGDTMSTADADDAAGTTDVTGAVEAAGSAPDVNPVVSPAQPVAPASTGAFHAPYEPA
ncbi:MULTISPECIES: PspC domain-containing protein, partial [unclassified Actinomyces]